MAIQKQRESNIELFRIITMLLIVAHHYVVNSGLIDIISENPSSPRSLFYLIFGAWGKTGINCFVLISGYYMCKSQISLRKSLKLILQIVFYSVFLYILFVMIGKYQFSKMNFLKQFLPIKSVGNGFVSCYLVFFFLIPFLNKALQGMDRIMHLILIWFLILIFTILPVVPYMYYSIYFSYVSWFVVLFFIGAYLRLYPDNLLCKQIGLRLVILLLLSTLSIVFFANRLPRADQDIYYAHYLLADSNKPLALLTAVYAFLYFKQLKIGYHKWINLLAASTFGVLLIHTSNRTWLWDDMLKNSSMYSSSLWVLHAILSVIAVFLVCSVIDMLRIRFLERPFFRWYDQNEARMLHTGRNYMEKTRNYVNRRSN